MEFRPVSIWRNFDCIFDRQKSNFDAGSKRPLLDSVSPRINEPRRTCVWLTRIMIESLFHIGAGSKILIKLDGRKNLPRHGNRDVVRDKNPRKLLLYEMDFHPESYFCWQLHRASGSATLKWFCIQTSESKRLHKRRTRYTVQCITGWWRKSPVD